MNERDFERGVLELVFRTNIRITPAAVAYRLGVSVSEAKRGLERLLALGVLELESDGEGHLYYVAPGAERPDKELPLALPRQVAAPKRSSLGLTLFAIFALSLFARLLLLVALLGGGPITLGAAVALLWLGLRALSRAHRRHDPAPRPPADWRW
jgi:hypothetical protein